MACSIYTYVYRIRSFSDSSQVYTGCTSNLEQRLKDHNRVHVAHTSKYCPWEIEVAIAFRDQGKARTFEKYLKSGSGRDIFYFVYC